MNINNKNLCASCFAEMGEGQATCAECGYSEAAVSVYPTALPVGTVLMGQYIIGRTLGKGGFGVTYLAYDTKDDKKVAVKEYLPDALIHRNTGDTAVSTIAGDKDGAFQKGAERFYEEAQMVSRFNGNPGLVWVYKFFYENNTAYFVMEYLDGFDLKHSITAKGGLLDEKQLLDIALPLIDSLIIVHSIGVLHRDISPDNIYMTSDGKIKLIDFGAARQVLGEVSKSLSVILKQGFAPIEQYQTRGKQGPWTDIYALGATMYYCLTGSIPDAPMDRLEEDNLAMPEGISDGLKTVMAKMLAVRAANRYQDMFELKRDMQAFGLIEAMQTVSLPQNAPANIPSAIPTSTAGIPASQQGYAGYAEYTVQGNSADSADLSSTRGKSAWGRYAQFIKDNKVVYGLLAASVVIITALALFLVLRGGGNTGDVIVPAGGGGVVAPPDIRDEPPVAPSVEEQLVGSWVGYDEEVGDNVEIAFNIGGEFYMLDDTDEFFVIEGNFSVSGNTLILIPTRGIFEDGGEIFDESFDGFESIDFAFKLDGNTLNLDDGDGDMTFTKGGSLGAWSFGQEAPTVAAKPSTTANGITGKTWIRSDDGTELAFSDDGRFYELWIQDSGAFTVTVGTYEIDGDTVTLKQEKRVLRYSSGEYGEIDARDDTWVFNIESDRLTFGSVAVLFEYKVGEPSGLWSFEHKFPDPPPVTTTPPPVTTTPPPVTTTPPPVTTTPPPVTTTPPPVTTTPPPVPSVGSTTWVGTWNAGDYSVAFELAFNNNNEFYLLMYVDEYGYYNVTEGTYRMSNDNKTIYVDAKRFIEFDGFDTTITTSSETDIFTFDGDTIILDMGDGTTVKLTKGGRSGKWTFGRQP